MSSRWGCALFHPVPYKTPQMGIAVVVHSHLATERYLSLSELHCPLALGLIPFDLLISPFPNVVRFSSSCRSGRMRQTDVWCARRTSESISYFNCDGESLLWSFLSFLSIREQKCIWVFSLLCCVCVSKRDGGRRRAMKCSLLFVTSTDVSLSLSSVDVMNQQSFTSISRDSWLC